MDYKRDVSIFLLVALRCQWVNIFCDILEVFDLASDRLPKFMAKKGSLLCITIFKSKGIIKLTYRKKNNCNIYFVDDHQHGTDDITWRHSLFQLLVILI